MNFKNVHNKKSAQLFQLVWTLEFFLHIYRCDIAQLLSFFWSFSKPAFVSLYFAANIMKKSLHNVCTVLAIPHSLLDVLQAISVFLRIKQKEKLKKPAKKTRKARWIHQFCNGIFFLHKINNFHSIISTKFFHTKLKFLCEVIWKFTHNKKSACSLMLLWLVTFA